MGIYISSKGIKNDTRDMPIEYLIRALKKARENGDTQNVIVLEEELKLRNNG